MKLKKMDKDNIKNILVIRRNNIGDMMCAIPILKSIRREFPEAHITVLADSTNSGIVEGASFIDRLLVYKKGRGIYGNKYFGCWRLFRQNKTEYDLAIALKIGFSSTLSLITLLSGAGLRMGCIPVKWHPFQYCYNLPVRGWKKWKSMQTVDAFFEFIRAGGIGSRVEDISIEIAPASRERVRAFFKVNVPADNKVIIFNISSNKPENTWPVERFRETANLLAAHYRITCMLTSTSSDRDRAVALAGDLNNAFYFETPGIMDFAALAADSDLLICGEGGAMHVGSGVHTPTISLWGRYRPVKWTPYGERQFVVKKDEHVSSILADDILDVVRKNDLLK